METKIKNKDSILCEGDVDSKRIVLNIAEKTLQKLDAYERIKSITKYENNILTIGTEKWDLSKKNHVYPVSYTHLRAHET